MDVLRNYTFLPWSRRGFAAEISTADDLASGSAGILSDTEIVEQNFSGIEQAKDEFVPARWTIIGRGIGRVAVGLPFARRL